MSEVFGPFPQQFGQLHKSFGPIEGQVKLKPTFKNRLYDKSTFPGLYGLAQEIHEALM